MPPEKAVAAAVQYNDLTGGDVGRGGGSGVGGGTEAAVRVRRVRQPVGRKDAVRPVWAHAARWRFVAEPPPINPNTVYKLRHQVPASRGRDRDLLRSLKEL